MPLESQAEQAKKQMRDEAARRLLAAAIELSNLVKLDLNVPNPGPKFRNPAPRGSFPHKRTGAGQRSVSYEPRTIPAIARDLRVRVGILASGRHLTILAAKGWKGIMDTLAANASKLQKIVEGK